MRSLLQELNQYLLDIQTNDSSYKPSYAYLDKLFFSEHKGLYDIIWYAADYGYTSFSLNELEKYKAGDTTQHCECDCEPCECDYHGQGFSWLIDVLVQHSDKVNSLTFMGTNGGSNGIRAWDFFRLMQYDVEFQNLKSLRLQLHEIGDHNLVVLGNDDLPEDHDQLTDLLAKFPNVEEVEAPICPSEAFFKMDFPALYYLRVQCDRNSNQFIRHLSNWPLLKQVSIDFSDVQFDHELSYTSPANKRMEERIKAKNEAIANADDPVQAKKDMGRKFLRELGFSEEEIQLDLDNPTRSEAKELLKKSCEDDEEVEANLAFYDEMGRWDENGDPDPDYENDDDLELGIDEVVLSPSYEKRTSFEDYKALFQSRFMRKSFHFTLRESYLTQEQLFELDKINPDIQFLHVPTHDDYYVGHRRQDLEQA